MLTDVDAARHCGNSDFTTTISCEMMIQQESKKLPNFLLLSVAVRAECSDHVDPREVCF